MADRICPVAECGRPLRGPLYCNRHRKRFARYGDPLALGAGRQYPPLEERFWAKVDKTETCWLWTGHRGREGYGRLGGAGELGTLAHRIAYAILVGPIPDGLQIDHKCRVRGCVNPAHLQAVDQSTNRQNLNGAYTNSSTGVRGVRRLADRKGQPRFGVRVKVNNVIHDGGYFTSLATAEAAAIALRNRLMTNNLLDREAS